MMTDLTIFTPTFNRAYILPVLYKSLCEQTSKDFIWLIVDDGSIDNTKDLIKKYLVENIIKIEYIFQENLGKMQAHNNGVLNCKTEFFICVDSDDYIVKNSVELIKSDLLKIKSDVRYSGLVYYKGKNENQVIEKEFPIAIDSSPLNSLYKKGFKGDTTLVYKTNILKQFLFPKIEGEKFITENFIYFQIDQKYLMKIIPKIIIVCNYLNDGYTKNSLNLLKYNPKGWAMYYNLIIKEKNNFINNLKNMANYIAFSLLGKNKNIIKNSNKKIFCFFIFPFGLYVFFKRKRQFRSEVSR